MSVIAGERRTECMFIEKTPIWNLAMTRERAKGFVNHRGVTDARDEIEGLTGLGRSSVTRRLERPTQPPFPGHPRDQRQVPYQTPGGSPWCL
jgi:hypothetical protein